MKKMFLIFVTVISYGIITNAQDVITLKNGTDIDALVQEIGDIDVKYKKFDNVNGPNYALKKSEILIIRYSNGSKDVFSEEEDVSVSGSVIMNNNGISSTNANFKLRKNSKIRITPYALSKYQTNKMCTSLEKKLNELGFCCVRRKMYEHDTDSNIDIIVQGAFSSFRFHIYDKTSDREVYNKRYTYKTTINRVVIDFIQDLQIARFIEE